MDSTPSMLKPETMPRRFFSLEGLERNVKPEKDEYNRIRLIITRKFMGCQRTMIPAKFMPMHMLRQEQKAVRHRQRIGMLLPDSNAVLDSHCHDPAKTPYMFSILKQQNRPLDLIELSVIQWWSLDAQAASNYMCLTTDRAIAAIAAKVANVAKGFGSAEGTFEKPCCAPLPLIRQRPEKYDQTSKKQLEEETSRAIPGS